MYICGPVSFLPPAAAAGAFGGVGCLEESTTVQPYACRCGRRAALRAD